MKLKQYGTDNIKPFEEYVFPGSIETHINYPLNWSVIVTLTIIIFTNVWVSKYLIIVIINVISILRWYDFDLLNRWCWLFVIGSIVCVWFELPILIMYFLPYLWYIKNKPIPVMIQIFLDVLFVYLLPMGFGIRSKILWLI